MSILIGGMLMGMHNNQSVVLDKEGILYAQIGEPIFFNSLNRMGYPVFVKYTMNNKVRSTFNFKAPVKSMQWDNGKKYFLCVKLHDNEEHQLDLLRSN